MPVFVRYLLGLGPGNPIAARLVQNGSRRVKHMYMRAAYLGALIIVLLWSLLLGTRAGTLSYQELAAAGAQSFQYIAYLQITLICVLAPVFMGGAIRQEANPKSWDVLLTTPMTAGQVVLGNLFGRLTFVFGLLFCSLPLFALTQYFGGVPGTAIFASYLIAGAAALLVGSIAIGLAVSRLAGKRAFFVFYVAIVSYLAVTIAIDAALRRAGNGVGPNGDGVTLMTSLNPFLALTALLNPTTYPRATEGTYSGVARWMLETPVTAWCLGSTIISLLFMLASIITVRLGGLTHLGEGEDGIPIWKKLFGRKTLGQAEGDGTTHRAPRTVWHNPIAWREAASRNSSPAKIIARWIFVALGLGFGIGLIWFYHTGQMSSSTFQFALSATIWGELLVIALVAINTAATAISKEREEGHLDLLLTTPITASAYIWGKLRGLVAYLVPLLIVPLGTLLLSGAYVLSGGIGRAGGVTATVPAFPGSAPVTTPVILPEAGLLAPLVVIPFMAFCVMVGLHWSLKSKGTLASTVWTVGVVGAISGIVGLCSWQALTGIKVIGPIMAGLSPAAYVFALTTPNDSMADTIGRSGQGAARMALAIGGVVGAGVFAALCYGLHNNMVRTFDVTVRKLAGQG